MLSVKARYLFKKSLDVQNDSSGPFGNITSSFVG